MKSENGIGTLVVDACVQLHRELGPGLLESVYEITLAHELRQRGLQVGRQVPVGIEYCGVRFEEAFRADLVVDERVTLELKCVEKVNNAHNKQLLTYLRLSGMKPGFLLNFGEALMRDDIPRIVNRLDTAPCVSWRSPRLGEKSLKYVDIFHICLTQKISILLFSALAPVGTSPRSALRNSA